MAIKINRLIVSKDDDGIRLDRWFSRHFPNISFIRIAKLVRKGEIKLDSKKAKCADRILEGQEISFPETLIQEATKPRKTIAIPDLKLKSLAQAIANRVLYKDEDILIIDKMSGLATQGGTNIDISLDDILPLLQFESHNKPKLVHRLDKETSGVMIIARNTSAAATLSEIIRTKKITKKYIAILCGIPEPSFGYINLPLEKSRGGKFESVQYSLNGKEAVTKYKLLDKNSDGMCLVEFQLITGKTHQLRAHSASINCPILGDKKYNFKRISFGFEKRLYLHSHFIEFVYDNKNISATAPLPQYFENTIHGLQLKLRPRFARP